MCFPMSGQHISRLASRYAGRTSCSIAVIVVFASCSVLRARAVATSAPAVDPALERILEKLESAERGIMNVQVIDFSLTSERLEPGTTQWTPWEFAINGTAWRNGLRNSKARVIVTRRVMEWENGLAPWVQLSEDIGYDGRFGRIARHSGGPMGGRPVPTHTGEILADPPAALNDRYQEFADGTSFTLAYGMDDKGTLLSQSIRKASAAGRKLLVSEVVVGNEHFVRIANTNPTYPVFYLLDPSRGYALRGVEKTVRKNGAWDVIEKIDISKLTEAAPGIWFPLQAIWEGRRPSNLAERLRFHYKASSVIVNDPNFDEAIFTVPFPDGYRVVDSPGATQFVAGGKKSDVARSVDRSIVEARGDLPLPSARPAASHAPAHDHRWWLVAIVTTSFAFVLAGVFTARHLRKSRASRVISVLTAAGGIIVSSANGSWGQVHSRQDNDPYVRRNCGVALGYFTLQWYNKPLDIATVGLRLNAGAEFENRCSFADLKRVFEDNGLSVAAVKTDRLSDVVGHAQEGSVIIVRLNRVAFAENIGHFVALVGAKGGRLALIDPPTRPIAVDMKEVDGHAFLLRATGECLIVTSPTARVAKGGPAIELAKKRIAIENIPFNTETFTADVVYRNIGDEPLKILDTKLGCTCQGTPTGDMEVGPGKSGTLHVHFDRKKIGAGRQEKAIVLVTNDPRQTQVPVHFAFTMPTAPKGDEFYAVPRAIDLGLATIRKGIPGEMTIRVMIPSEWLAGVPPKVTVTPSHTSLRVRDERSASDKVGEGRYYSIPYTVTWEGPIPAGAFREAVSFNLESESQKPAEIKVMIRGEFINGPAESAAR